MMKNILQINDYLDELIPNPICELNYKEDYQFVIAVMLSAQTTDKAVNRVTELLFKKYASLESLSKADVNDLTLIIKPIGNQNKKALNVLNIAEILINTYQGIVPRTHDELMIMSGIGRKCANVILGELYNIPSFAVDTHVIRVSNRLGLVNSKDPIIIEKKLEKLFKKEEWVRKHKQLVLFGRYYCKSTKPECEGCKFVNMCKYIKQL